VASAPLIVAGVLAIVGAAIHGAGGELLVVRKLSLDRLPSTRFGGARTTMAMIHVVWHVTTLAFLTVGVALILSGAVLDGDAAEAIAVLAAGAATAFAVVMVGLALANTRSPRALFRHLGPLTFVAIAALAWWGAI
jgi:hypothetical protein